MLNKNRSHDYTWSKAWIEFKAPNADGVYVIQDKEGKVIFVGMGNIRERLLSHWNRENSTDIEVWNQNPRSYRFELTDHPADRQAELIRELKPACPGVPYPKFPKIW